MPYFVSTFVGIVAGILLIGGVIYFAVRPEMRPKRRKSLLAKPSGEPHDLGGGPPGDSWLAGSGDTGHGS
jgi:hypothetical protein